MQGCNQADWLTGKLADRQTGKLEGLQEDEGDSLWNPQVSLLTQHLTSYCSSVDHGKL